MKRLLSCMLLATTACVSAPATKPALSPAGASLEFPAAPLPSSGLPVTSGVPVTLSVSAPVIVNKFAAEDPYPQTQVLFGNGVIGLPDITFATPQGLRPLKLDLYLPPKNLRPPVKGYPLVIYIHGGGWSAGDPRHTGFFADFPSVLASLSARGYVVASVTYRFSPEGKFPAQANDIKTALRFLRFRAKTYGLDPSKAVAWGSSSGAYLASWVALTCAEKTSPECVQAAVLWSGIFDLTTLVTQAEEQPSNSQEKMYEAEWRLLGCNPDNCPDGRIAEASPVNFVDANDPPLLLVVGRRDKVVPVQQTLELAQKLRDVSAPHELLVLPKVGHLFQGKTLDETTEASLKALSATFDFIDKTMSGQNR